MKSFFLFILIILSFHSGMRGNPLWKSIDNSNSEKCVTITTIESSEKAYKAKINIHGYYDNQIVVEGTTYHRLSFDEPASLSFVGEPALPILSQLIAIPKGDNFEVRISNEKWTDDIPIGLVMPCQKDYFETEEAPPFEKNEVIYNGDFYQFERVLVGEQQRWRSVINRALNICPVRYMPRKGKISVLKEFVLEILFDKTAKDNTIASEDMHLFLNCIDTTEGNNTNQLRDTGESYDYLIIAGNISGVLSCQALSDFQKWKAFKGNKTKVVSTNSIGTTDSQIKQYITNEYTNGVRYVLFIGDSDKIPLHNYYNSYLSSYVKSDYWYGCMDGNDDVQADICIGRFSTNNLSELTNMVNKTMSYEKNARNYGKQVLLVAHCQDAPYKYQGCLETIRTASYNEPVSFTKAYGAESSFGGNNAANAMVVNEINGGKNIINYRGHGDYNCWAWWNYISEYFYDSQINSLNNTTNDVYFCIACSIGNIHNQTCFMETFTRSDHGAAGMIAATEDSYTYVNHTYNQYLFSKLLNDNIYGIEALSIASHMANISALTDPLEHNRAIYNTFSYLCGGDPSLEIWTGNTKTFDDYMLTMNGQNITVNNGNIGGYKVCVVNENGSLFSAINSTSSSCTFSIPTGNFYLALNKHNYVPRIIYVNRTDSYIQNKTFEDADIDYYYIKNGTISAGYDVTTSVPYGNVSIENGSRLNIDKSGGVLIKNGFKVEHGGELQIK